MQLSRIDYNQYMCVRALSICASLAPTSDRVDLKSDNKLDNLTAYIEVPIYHTFQDLNIFLSVIYDDNSASATFMIETLSFS